MANFFYIDAVGQKQGPVNDQQLRALVAQGTITAHTALETEGGHKGVAGQIPGLFAVAQPTQAMSVAQLAPNQIYCTNCGNPVFAQAVACTTCGAKPAGHRKFCRHCGAGLNPEQVMCVKCGVGISAVESHAGGSSGKSKSRITAAILAICFGAIGVHKFYLGSWGWGIVYCAVALLTAGTGAAFTLPVSLVEFIMYLRMTDEEFARKYSPDTRRAFRW